VITLALEHHPHRSFPHLGGVSACSCHAPILSRNPVSGNPGVIQIERWSHRLPEFSDWLEETIEQTLTVFRLPKNHRVRLRTTNNLEKLHQEVKRRTRVVRIFPNRRSCLRLASALAMEQSDE